jgi:glycosyltransferase involved in cell wall biosynthesis
MVSSLPGCVNPVSGFFIMKKYDLYTYTFNDEDILPFFLDYYKWVDRMTFIDSGSTDRTLQILEKFAEDEYPLIRIINTGLTFWNQEVLHEYRNIAWKDSKMDLILFPDCDEIFYIESGIREYLEATNYDIYEMDGYEMVSDIFPKKLPITNIKTGFYHHVFNKSTIFSPKCDIVFLNAHIRCSTSEKVDMSGHIKLLHYRSMGLESCLKRNKRMADRLPKGYTGHHAITPEKTKERFYKWRSQAKIVI